MISSRPNRPLSAALVGGLSILAATAALAATVSATNSHHDSTATSGRLEKGCQHFELSGTTLNTKCNKVSGAGIGTFHDATDISSDVSDGCDRWQYITPKSDGVTVGYKCSDQGSTIEKDLNDVVWWDPSNGQTHLR